MPTIPPFPGWDCSTIDEWAPQTAYYPAMLAQYYMGLIPVGIVAANADVNRDSTINIVDASITALYYVGLINPLGCQT